MPEDKRSLPPPRAAATHPAAEPPKKKKKKKTQKESAEAGTAGEVPPSLVPPDAVKPGPVSLASLPLDPALTQADRDSLRWEFALEDPEEEAKRIEVRRFIKLLQ